MRKLKCFEMHGLGVTEVLEDFNERAAEFGITKESDVVSVIGVEPDPKAKIASIHKGTASPKMLVVITYWSDRP